MVKNLSKRNLSGFTLIELLVVVLIIGILAAIAVPQYTKSVEKSRASQLMVSLDAYVKSQSLYHLANGKYHFYTTPETIEANTGVSLPTLSTDQWQCGMSCFGCDDPEFGCQRKITPTYALKVQINHETNEVLRYCCGDEKMCKVIGGGAVCTEGGSANDSPWCYSSSWVILR